MPGSVLELAAIHLGPVQGQPPAHSCIQSLRGPQGLGDSLLCDLGVVRGFPVRTAHVPDRENEESQGWGAERA